MSVKMQDSNIKTYLNKCTPKPGSADVHIYTAQLSEENTEIGNLKVT